MSLLFVTSCHRATLRAVRRQDIFRDDKHRFRFLDSPIRSVENIQR